MTPSFPTPPLALPAPAAVPTAVPVAAAPGPPDRNPAAVYLAGKPSAVGRRGLQRSLERAAEVLTGGLTTDAFAVNWAEVRYQHVMALRSLLIEGDAKPATINHVLAAVRGVIREGVAPRADRRRDQGTHRRHQERVGEHAAGRPPRRGGRDPPPVRDLRCHPRRCP